MPVFNRLVAAALALLLLSAGYALDDGSRDGRALGYSLLSGALFGVLLQRSRFCFFCVTRDFLEQRKAEGWLGIIAALAVGTVGYHLVFAAFVPQPLGDRLPPDAHIGPVSLVLVLAATLFGVGMAISGSCVSAHLYRLGEGAIASFAALAGALLGFILGLAVWNSLYLTLMQEAPVIWLPNHLGYGGSLLVQLGLLGALAAWLLRYRTPPEPSVPATGLVDLLFTTRWPTWVGGVLIGALAVAAYFRVAPLGVTAELGSLARTGADALGWLPARLEGLDSFAGCATAVKDTLLSNNGVFISALVLAAWASALASGDFKARWPAPREWLRNALGGVLLGFGSLLALGCTVGTLLSGIMAGAASGWVFALCCVVGMILGLKLRPWLHLG